MLNVSFKKGTQDNLNALVSYQEGSFYLATDTERLYYAQSVNKLSLLNQCIKSVETEPEYSDDIVVGDIYYVSSTNEIIVVAEKDDENQTVTFTKVVSKNNINDFEITESVEDNVATINLAFTLQDDEVKESDFKIGSSSLSIQKNDMDDCINMDLTWGEF